MSLRLKFIIYTLAVILFFGALSAIGVFFVSRNEILRHEERVLYTLTQGVIGQIEQVFFHATDTVRGLATNPSVVEYLSEGGDGSSQDILARLNRFNFGNNYLEISLLSSSGEKLVSTNPDFLGENYSSNFYFREAVLGGQAVDVALGSTSGELGFYFSHAVKSDDGQFLGVALMKLKPDSVYQYLSLDESAGSAKVLLTDDNGVVLYISQDSDSRQFMSLGPLSDDLLASIKNQRRFEGVELKSLTYYELQDVIEKNLGGKVNVFSFYDEADAADEVVSIGRVGSFPFYVMIEEQQQKFILAAVSGASSVAALVVVGASLAIFIILFLTIRLLRPIKILEKRALDFVAGDFLSRLEPNTGTREMDLLFEAFNQASESVLKSREEIEKKVAEQTKEIAKRQKISKDQQDAILNVLDDVEREKNKAKALAEDLEKFKIALDNASDHIIITDPDGVVLYGNKSVEKITGFKLKEVLGNKAAMLWKMPMPEDYYKKLWKSIKKDKKPFTGEIQNIRKNGETYFAEITITPVLDQDKNVKYFLGIERDISERKDNEMKITNALNSLSEQKHILEKEKVKDEAILASIGDGVVVTDQHGDIILMNKTGCEMLGYSQKEVIGKPVVDIINVVYEDRKPVPTDERPSVVAFALKQMVTTTVKEKLYYQPKVNKPAFPVSVTVSPFVEGDNLVGSVIVFRDITDEAAIDKAKTEFVSLASHQLRTPLSIIGWYVEMLLSGDAGKLKPEQQEYLKQVYDSNKRMTELVNSLLDVSRLEMGTFVVEPEVTDITKMMESVVTEVQPQIKQKQLKFKTKVDKKVPAIKVDPKLMRMVFQNLLSNAIKYTPDKGEVKVTLELSDATGRIKAKNNTYILFTVSDTGYGIPKRQQDKIFTKLFRADNVKEKDVEGTGLGLYIIKSIIDHAGGRIWFKSAENQGTKFFVTIPLVGMKAKVGTKRLQ